MLLLLNGLLLLGVVIVPYPTKMLAEYARDPDAKVAAMLHAGTFVMITVFFNLLWRYISHNRLLDPGGYCSMIRKGKYIPHPRHWDVLSRIRGR
jgi:hypothetical protein